MAIRLFKRNNKAMPEKKERILRPAIIPISIPQEHHSGFSSGESAPETEEMMKEERKEQTQKRGAAREEEHLMREFVEGSKLISDANKKLMERLKEYDQKIAVIDELENENFALRRSIAKKDQTVAALNQALSESKKANEKIREKELIILKLSDEIGPLRKKYENMISVVESLKGQIENDMSLIRKQNLEITRLKNTPKVKEAVGGNLVPESVIEGLRKESENEKALMRDLYNNMELLKDRNIRKENIITSLKNAVNKLEMKSRDKDKAIIDLNATAGALRMKISSLEREKAGVKQHEDLLNSRIQALTAKINGLKDEIDEKDKYYPLLVELERHNIEADNEEFLRSVESEIILLKTENKRLRNEIDSLNKRVESRKEKEREILAKLKTVVASEEELAVVPDRISKNPKIREVVDLINISIAAGDSLDQAKKSVIKQGYNERVVSEAAKVIRELMQ